LEWLNKKYKNLNGCKFIDHVPRGKLGIYLSKCRVLAMPSWIESYGNSALEVMAAGRPVVVTSTMGMSELVRESGNGTVIPPGDSRALAQALLPYLLDTNHAQQAGLKAKNVVNRVNNPDIIAEQIEKTFTKAIYSYHQKNLSKYKCRIYRTFKKLSKLE
jgi:glycosyltransferase involved in cell wall biosynthesis